ncbi:hypothetical protein [Galbitalea soli]|uniref:Uncharacterized protein n=1 Tax=Galbitalea soli TaxID=1268042 RepID=A0A7C9TT74_9MICO|nr:hypothetical protein [Galbitalea soli]NEM92162.1 hypothetical protein [Galbitalea soli]NYJ31884.1 hypothetical protein [Galbitalea soli]
MANTLFASRDQFFDHIVTPLPLSGGGKDALFTEFREHGYLARQEAVGLTVLPRGIFYGVFAEGDPGLGGQVQVVLLSNPALTDDVFDGWVEVLQQWTASFDLDLRGAMSRKVRDLKAVDRGVPANLLHKDIPLSFLLSYSRRSDFVMVIDPPSDSQRRIYTTKGIG